MKNPMFMLAGVMVVLAIVFLLLSWSNNRSSESSTEFPTAGTAERPEAAPGKRIVYSADGYLEINDVVREASKHFDGDVHVVAENSEYSIVYYAQSDFFLVSLLDPASFEAARSSAEQALLDELGITQEEACTLSVDLVVPPYVDFDRAGSYGLSYCVN